MNTLLLCVFLLSGGHADCTGSSNSLSPWAGGLPISFRVGFHVFLIQIIICKFYVILQVAIVVGGRNFFCGDSWISATGLERSTAYQIG